MELNNITFTVLIVALTVITGIALWAMYKFDAAQYERDQLRAKNEALRFVIGDHSAELEAQVTKLVDARTHGTRALSGCIDELQTLYAKHITTVHNVLRAES